MSLEPGHEVLILNHTHYNRAYPLRATYAGTNAIKGLYNLIVPKSKGALDRLLFVALERLKQQAVRGELHSPLLPLPPRRHWVYFYAQCCRRR